MGEFIKSAPLNEIFEKHPYAEDFFVALGMQPGTVSMTLTAYLDRLPDEVIEDCGMDRCHIVENFVLFLQKMNDLKTKTEFKIDALTVTGGYDKAGNREKSILTMKPGEVVCIVGPTGSGKSRLLADIECLAQKDTPTGRQVLLNGEAPDADKRFSIEHKLVAQLSQNMNFIMDLTVGEFITMHAESRMIENIDQTVLEILKCANELAGEMFTMDAPVTALSGGQSRALMIADTALLSSSPVVLIDEIENAGIDRRKALELLVKEEKMILMSTHDPILALLGDKRLVIKNGGIHKMIETSPIERENLVTLQKLDAKMLELRNMLRNGEEIGFNIQEFFE